jgi:hypothetical protein
MNGFNGEIGLLLAKDRMQDLHRDAALARRTRAINGEPVVATRTARSLITLPFRLLGAGR